MISFKTIRTSHQSKIIVSFITLNLLFGGVFPSYVYGMPEGPTQPEFNNFTPIGASDMVDLSSGNFNYSIPIIDVGGYPMSLGYSSSTPFDAPASWVGHGWNLSAGQINRSMRTIPDDFNGDDKIHTENNKRTEISTTVGFSTNLSPLGKDLGLKNISGQFGLNLSYSNFYGYNASPSFGVSYTAHKNFDVGLNLTPSSDGGTSVGLNISKKEASNWGDFNGAGLNFNSFRKSFSVNASLSSNAFLEQNKDKNGSFGLGESTLSLRSARFNPSFELGYTNFAGSVNGALGATFFLTDVKGEGYLQYTERRLKDSFKDKSYKAIGYNHYYKNSKTSMKDFSNSFSRGITPSTSFLSVPQNTYDYYSISGQGLSGSFRPFQSSVTYVYDPQTINSSGDFSLEAELAGGNLFKAGGNVSGSFNDSRTGLWEFSKGNNAISKLRGVQNPLDTDLPADFQNTYFKFIGENTLKHGDDNEENPFITSIGDKSPVRFNLNGLKSNENKYAQNQFPVGTTTVASNEFASENRIPTSKTITPISIDEIKHLNTSLNSSNSPNKELNKIELSTKARNHHQAGFRITDNAGTLYNYLQPLYTTSSSQIQFSVGNTNVDTADLIRYSNVDNSSSNSNGMDHTYDKRTVDPYAHTSLLKSILSSDYRDLKGDGPSPDDLGSYTLFTYDKNQGAARRYRFPVENNHALYNEGLISVTGDNKGSITYGEKEVAYLERIITKTHVAYFKLNENNFSDSETVRKDNIAARDENIGVDLASQRARYLDKIYLYSLKQAEEIGLLNATVPNSFDPTDPQNPSPLKVVHFDYDYNLQKTTSGTNLPDSENGHGKLTLKKVYFTYGKSNMGKYTPYTFEYKNDTNFSYHNLNKDLWGNYMPNVNDYSITGEPTNSEHPYTNQEKIQSPSSEFEYVADEDISYFLLSKINLPSGGEITPTYEADDYSYVQDEQIMKMYNIVGAGDISEPPSLNFNDKVQIYSGNNVKKYIYLELGNSSEFQGDAGVIQEKITENLSDSPLYFKILSKINNSNNRFKDVITGFVYMDNNSDSKVFNSSGKSYISIPLQQPRLNGKTGVRVHPFAKATWNYVRSFMPSVGFRGEDNTYNNFDPTRMVTSLIGSVGQLLSIFSEPNRQLMKKNCGDTIYANKSWLRLNNISGFKKGGGARVSKVIVDSNWDVMTNNTSSQATSTYGQEYNYTVENGNKSSGVATYEPAQSDENPFKIPLEDRTKRTAAGDNVSNLIDKFLAPANANYVMGPLMGDYYPNPTVTYSRVEVKNYKPEHPNDINKVIKSRATGSVVHQFYTSKDFPVKETNTPIQVKEPFIKGNMDNFVQNLIGFPANMYTDERLAASQGFAIETNDMNGKPKSQTVYSEGAFGDDFITKSITEYQVDEEGNLDNFATFINNKGSIHELETGVEYDIVNYFNYASSETYTGFVDGNAAGAIFGIWFQPAFTAFPGGTLHTTKLRSSSTAKHIHRAGIVKSTTVIDNGSSITTSLLAYDYLSKQPILKAVNNEFNDVIYNLDFPAYWRHEEMANASINQGMTFKADQSGNSDFYISDKRILPQNNASEKPLPLLINGDEVKIEGNNNETFWIDGIAYESNGKAKFLLINKDNDVLSPSNPIIAKVVRSAYDNKQAQAISSLSMRNNPLLDTNGNPRAKLPDTFDNIDLIYNASAIEMSDRWDPECECGYEAIENEGYTTYEKEGAEVNPYVHNILGQYRPKKSYAYLSGRKSDFSGNSLNTKEDGFYNDFYPFYQFENGDFIASKDVVGPIDPRLNKWTYASEVSKINPYGLELENTDALNRHSSAMYGFNNKFPVAVASNTAYSELAYDGFEDYDYHQCETIGNTHHFAFAKAKYHTLTSPGLSYSPTAEIDWNQHITNEEYHTGKNSIKVDGGNQAIGVDFTINPCQQGNSQYNEERLIIFINMVYHYIRNLGSVPSGCINDHIIQDYLENQIYSMTEGVSFDDLGVCNIVFTPDRLSFDLTNNNSSEQPHILIEVPPYYDNHPNHSCDGYWYNFSNNDMTDLIFGDEAEQMVDQWPDGRYTLPDGYDGFAAAQMDCDLIYRFNVIDLEKEICLDCTSFNPNVGSEYVISAWVKENIDRSNISTPQQLAASYPERYFGSILEVTFADATGTQVSPHSRHVAQGKGAIINGWQKIYQTFTVPANANMMKVILRKAGANPAYFDDIRIHPVNGSMKSFVYDQDNFRLKAELDDNNYATFYEYDLEGNLIRIKKETSRGIQTIQESRQSISKKFSN